MGTVLVALGVIFAWFALAVIIVLVSAFFAGFFEEYEVHKPQQLFNYLADHAEAIGRKLGKKVKHRG